MTDAAFWDRAAPRYSRRPISNMEAYEATLARVKEHLSDGDSVLEFGCGTGSTALVLAPFVRDYEGTDISRGMIDIANGKLSSSATANLSFRVARIGAGDNTGKTPDKILAFNLLHLVPDLERALGEIHDLLPAGGYFISKTPCVGSKWYLRPLVGILQMIGKAPYVNFLKVPELDEMIGRAGFEIVETALLPPSTPSRFIVARKA